MNILMMLLRPKALVSGGAIGLIFLAVYVGPQLGLSWLWIGIAVAVVAVLWIAIMLIMRARAAKAARALERSLERQAERQLQSARPGREGEIEEIRRNLLQAVDALKTSRVGKSGGKSALYVLPWYMIIGPPASGKTTLLTNSGLNFPYMDPSRKRPSVRGVGGTRNCDWWFADEAVILDTAGRYVLPVEADDSQEWIAFLDLLRQNRGRKPINGLIVAVSVQDLLEGGEESVEHHATKIRSRIDELIDKLGISFPIYVLFTKCDLIRGFVEFYGDLSKAERAEAWGATFARDRVARTPAIDLFDREIDALAATLRAARIPRLAQESRAESRPEILFFPMQFDALRPRLSLFIQTLFKENPYQERPIFRGFYMTSGTQEGRPIDQVINAMLSGFGIDRGDEGMYVEPSQPKSYFIENVFSKVMFPDRHIAGPSAEEERRRRRRRVRLFMAGAVGLAVLFVALLWLSALNRSLLGDVHKLSDRATAFAESDLSELKLSDLKTLDDLRGKLGEMEHKGNRAAKFALLGTYQGEKAEQKGRELYLGVLYDGVMKPLRRPLEVKLNDNADSLAVDFIDYYQWYRAWRILLDPGERLMEGDAPLLADLLYRHWSPSAGLRMDAENEEYRRLLETQLVYASRYPVEMGRLFPPAERGTEVLDDMARSALRRGWTADTIYPSLRRSASQVGDVSVASILGGDVGVKGSIAVPGAFTEDAWKGPVEKFLDEMDDIREGWTMQRAFGAEPPAIRGQLVAAYARDYRDHWINFMGGVEVQTGNEQATKVFLDRAAQENSPILKILRAVSDNTSLGDEADPNLIAVTEAFAPIEEFFRKPGPNPFKILRKSDSDAVLSQEYLEKVNALSQQYADVAKAPSPGQSAPVLGLLSWVERQIPEDPSNPVTTELARILATPATTVTGTAVKGKTTGVQDAWGMVYRDYQRTLAGRYPFSSGGRDASLADVEAFFGPQGSFWKYYDENLASIVTPDGEPMGADVKLSPAFLGALKKADQIRRALFADGGRAGFRMSLRPAPPRPDDPAIVTSQVRLDIGGQSLVWRTGPRTWTEFNWPGTSPEQGALIRVDAGTTGRIKDKTFGGAWGFFKLLEEASIGPGGNGSDLTLTWSLEGEPAGIKVLFDVSGLPAVHPLRPGFFRFSLPERITAGN